MTTGSLGGLVLAAGISERMGRFKPLMEIAGKALIEHSVSSMLRAGISGVTVVLGHRADEVEAVLSRSLGTERLRFAYNRRYRDSDMLCSVKVGLREMADCGAFFLLPGDMPAVSRGTFLAVAEAMERTGAMLAFPVLAGGRKHPPLISSRCIPDILCHEGGGGLRSLWAKYENDTAQAPVDDPGCDMDNDTPEDYARCAAYMEQRDRL